MLAHKYSSSVSVKASSSSRASAKRSGEDEGWGSVRLDGRSCSSRSGRGSKLTTLYSISKHMPRQ